jgi:hypothetical protein
MRESLEQLVDRDGRVPEGCGLGFENAEHGPRGEVDEVQQEDVGGLGLDAVGLKCFGWEVGEVLGDDDL